MMPNRNLPHKRPVTGDNETCLQIENLSVVRGQRMVIDRLTHSQSWGELCVLTGTNGVGKSTLLRTIAGRLPADSGHIRCQSQCVYVGHADGLAGAISGKKNLQNWAAIYDLDVTNTNINQALEAFDALDFADIPIQILSRGQRRRLALARLLLTSEQSLWLLDEPNTGLDSNGQARLEYAINCHLATGGSVIAATHIALAASTSTSTIHLVLGL